MNHVSTRRLTRLMRTSTIELTPAETTLNKKIDKVKMDLNNNLDKLKWFICIAVAVGSIITSGVVALIVHMIR